MPFIFAIVTAIKEEEAAVRAALPNAEHDGILIARCGVGPASAEKFVRALLTEQPSLRAVCSSGVCGGLADDLQIGDCVLSKFLMDAAKSGSMYEVPFNLKPLNEALVDAGLRSRAEIFVSTDVVVCSSDDKRVLQGRSQACAVDMETYGMLKATERRVPVFALRAISDTVDESLPPQIAEFLDANGKLRVGKVAGFVLTRPHKVPALMRLGKNTKKACESLTTAWRAGKDAALGAISN